MISETFIYASNKDSLFKQISKQVPALEGRYHVSPNYGHDLNTTNLEEFLKDDKYGLTGPEQKYPICVCITPRSRLGIINDASWEQIYFTLYLLQQSLVKKIDRDTNTSAQAIYEDWAEMKNAAIQFIGLLQKTLQGTLFIDDAEQLFRTFVSVDFEKIDIRRLSSFNDDNLSGVELSFSLFLNLNECLIELNPDIFYEFTT